VRNEHFFFTLQMNTEARLQFKHILSTFLYGVYCENLLQDVLKFEQSSLYNKDAELHKVYCAKFLELQN
jgi:hypothetical protein